MGKHIKECTSSRIYKDRVVTVVFHTVELDKEACSHCSLLGECYTAGVVRQGVAGCRLPGLSRPYLQCEGAHTSEAASCHGNSLQLSLCAHVHMENVRACLDKITFNKKTAYSAICWLDRVLITTIRIAAIKTSPFLYSGEFDYMDNNGNNGEEELPFNKNKDFLQIQAQNDSRRFIVSI